MKWLKILVSETKYPPYKVVLQPHTTVSDIRKHLQLNDDYVLALAATPHWPFDEGDDVYALVTSGSKLIAMTPVQAADAFMEHIAFGEGEI
jgi:hypothetical protein